MNMPQVGSILPIESVKHDQTLHRKWNENTILYSNEGIVIGKNNQTTVQEGSGAKWTTSIPALFYFHRQKWFNIIYVMERNVAYYYCNISSPFHFQNNKIQYIDYDIDFIVQLDYTYTIVDRDEYEDNKKRYLYSDTVQHNVKKAVNELEEWINQRKDPFNTRFVQRWHPF